MGGSTEKPKITKKSEFNIEKEDGQEFPPIHS